MILENGVVLCLKWTEKGEMLACDHRGWVKVSRDSHYVPDLVTSGFGIEFFFKLFTKYPFKNQGNETLRFFITPTPLFSPPFICYPILVIGSHTPSFFTTTNNPFRRTHTARLTIRNTIYSSSSLSSPISCSNSSSLSNSISFLSIGYASISIDTLTIGTTVSASISDLVNIGTIVFVSDMDNSFVPIPLFSSLSLNPPSSRLTS